MSERDTAGAEQPTVLFGASFTAGERRLLDQRVVFSGYVALGPRSATDRELDGLLRPDAHRKAQ